MTMMTRMTMMVMTWRYNRIGRILVMAELGPTHYQYKDRI
jgi:hypothetical protein